MIDRRGFLQFLGVFAAVAGLPPLPRVDAEPYIEIPSDSIEEAAAWVDRNIFLRLDGTDLGAHIADIDIERNYHDVDVTHFDAPGPLREYISGFVEPTLDVRLVGLPAPMRRALDSVLAAGNPVSLEFGLKDDGRYRGECILSKWQTETTAPGELGFDILSLTMAGPITITL